MIQEDKLTWGQELKVAETLAKICGDALFSHQFNMGDNGLIQEEARQRGISLESPYVIAWLKPRFCAEGLPGEIEGVPAFYRDIGDLPKDAADLNAVFEILG